MLTLELAIVDVEAWLLPTAQVVSTSTATLSLERLGVDEHGLAAVPLEPLEVQAGPPLGGVGAVYIQVPHDSGDYGSQAWGTSHEQHLSIMFNT